jgi:hypothetical protein
MCVTSSKQFASLIVLTQPSCLQSVFSSGLYFQMQPIKHAVLQGGPGISVKILRRFTRAN